MTEFYEFCLWTHLFMIFFFFFWVKYTYSFRLRHCSDALAYCSVLCLLYMNFSQISLRFELQQISTVLKQHIFFLPQPAVYIPATGKHSCLHSNRREEMPLVEYTWCMNCHRVLPMIVVLGSGLFITLNIAIYCIKPTRAMNYFYWKLGGSYCI